MDSGRPNHPRKTRTGNGGAGKKDFSPSRGKVQRAARPVAKKGILAFMKGIADTGFIVAFGNRGDTHHDWALNIAKGLSEPLITCEAVLAEAAFHLGSSSYVLGLLRDRLLALDFSFVENLEHLWLLSRSYEGRKPDLADLCLIRMSELYPRHTIITVDEADFRVYRRNKREMIPILCPPRS